MPLFREIKTDLNNYCTIVGTQGNLTIVKILENFKRAIYAVAYNFLIFGKAKNHPDTSKGGKPASAPNEKCALHAYGLLAGNGNSSIKITTGKQTLSPPEYLLTNANANAAANPPNTFYNPEISLSLSSESLYSNQANSGAVLKPNYFYSYSQKSNDNTGFKLDCEAVEILSYWYKNNTYSWEYKFNGDYTAHYQYRGSQNSLIKFNGSDNTVYLYANDSVGSGWAKMSGQDASVKAGFGGDWEGNSSYAVLGLLDRNGNKIGLGYQTLYNYFYISSKANSDNMNLVIGNNNNQNYISLYADGQEASIWTYDLYGTSLLWNTKSEGKLHLYNDMSSFQISVDSAYGESAFWSYDEQGNSLLWNSRNTGILQMWNDWTDTSFSFYGRGQSSFWFDHYNYTDLKFSSILGILQVWNNDRRSYIDLSVYDIEPLMTCKFRYVKCKGKILVGSNGQNIMILASSDIDICDPKLSGQEDCSADSVIKYNNY